MSNELDEVWVIEVPYRTLASLTKYPKTSEDSENRINWIHVSTVDAGECETDVPEDPEDWIDWMSEHPDMHGNIYKLYTREEVDELIEQCTQIQSGIPQAARISDLLKKELLCAIAQERKPRND